MSPATCLAAGRSGCHRQGVVRRLPSRSLALSLSLVAGCTLGPTRADAERLLRTGHPAEALAAARQAVERAPAEEVPALRRLAFEAGLEAGLSREAAREYEELHRLTGRDDPELLLRLGRESLLLAAADPDPTRRLSAAACAAWAPGGAELAARGLRDPLPEVRAGACATAARLPWGQALHLVGEAARQDEDPFVRGEAFRALARRARVDQAPGPCLVLAQNGLADPDPGVRALAIELLDALAQNRQDGPPGPLVEALVAAGRSASDEQRAAVVRVLQTVDPDQAARVASTTTSAWVDALGGADTEALRGLLRADYSTRLLVVRHLARAHAGAELLPDLSRLAAADPATPVRAAALEAVARHGGPELVRPHLRHAHPGTRRSALRQLLARAALHPAERLALLGDPALAPDLAESLARGSPEEVAALRGLALGPEGEAGFLPALAALTGRADADPLLLPRLRELLLHPDPDLAALAARGLAASAEPEDRTLIVHALATAGGPDVAAAAALAALEERVRLSAPGLHAE